MLRLALAIAAFSAIPALAAASTQGPLRVHPDNPRYFADRTGKAVYLAGAHDGWKLQDFAWGDTVKEERFDWQDRMVDFIRACERTRPMQHPVGITVPFGGARRGGLNNELFQSLADWISPNREASGGFNYRDNPPPGDGRKVILTDSDHLYGNGLQEYSWVWRSFCRGHNVLFMDRWTEAPDDPLRIQVRQALGQTRRFAAKMDLAATQPRPNLASTKYSLADPGRGYLVYLPTGGTVTVDLSSSARRFSVEWLDPQTGRYRNGTPLTGGGRRTFASPFRHDAVLYLRVEE